MSAVTVDLITAPRPTVEPRRRGSAARPAAPTRRRPRRPGPGVGPVARPGAAVPAPSVAPVRLAPARACRPEPDEAPQVAATRQWRLTERGLAVVMVAAAVLLSAAVAVVTLTAFQVTGDGYRAGGSSANSVSAQP